MKNIEKEITRKVYRLETRRTSLEIFVKTMGIFTVGLLVMLAGLLVFTIFSEQQTFDLLQIFQEDPEVITRHFFETLGIFYEETPKILLAVFAAGIAALVFLIVQIARNFTRIKNKVQSIVRYWFSR